MKTVFNITYQMQQHRLTQFSNKYITGHMSVIIDPSMVTNVFNSMSLPDALKSLLDVNWDNRIPTGSNVHVGQIVSTGQATTRNSLALLLNGDGERLLMIAEAKPSDTGMSIMVNVGYSGDRTTFDTYLKELNIDINECDVLYMSDK